MAEQQQDKVGPASAWEAELLEAGEAMDVGHTRAQRGTREAGGEARRQRKLARGHGEEAEALQTAAAGVIWEHPSRRTRQGHTQAAGMESVGGDAGQ